MGRGKLNMKCISKEKIRISTYHKRKQSLTKKAEEFSILCGVETCLIIYGPKLKDSAAKIEIWPSDPSKVMNVINKYKAKPLDVRERKCFNVFDFLAIRQKKLNDEICKIRKANTDAKFSTWDVGINNFSVNEIWALLARLDSRLEAAKKEIMMIKGQQQCSIEDSKKLGTLASPGTQDQARACLSQKNLDFQVTSQKQPMPGLKPFDMDVHSYFPFGSRDQMQPLDLNHTYNLSTMLCTNGSNYTQVDGESSSGVAYSSLSPQGCYHSAAPMVDNVRHGSNPWRAPICFYGSFMLPMTSSGQSAFPSFPYQFSNFYHDFGDQYGSENMDQKL
ncbi:hypothetical protein DITRI_Ditri16bG0075900 [Diplodiscus trichospermus]